MDTDVPPFDAGFGEWVELLEGDDDEDVGFAADRHGVEWSIAADREHRVDAVLEVRRCCVLAALLVLDDADRFEVMERAVDDEDGVEVIGVGAAAHPIVIGDRQSANSGRLGHGALLTPRTSAVAVASK